MPYQRYGKMCCILQVSQEVIIRWKNQLSRFFSLQQLLTINRHSSTQRRVGIVTGLSRHGRKNLSHVKQRLEIVNEREQKPKHSAIYTPELKTHKTFIQLSFPYSTSEQVIKTFCKFPQTSYSDH